MEMGINDFAWIEEHRSRLDPLLVSLLFNQSKLLRLISNFTDKYSFISLNRFRSIPVLIQYDQKSTLADIEVNLKSIGVKIKNVFQDINTIHTPIKINHLKKILNISDIRKIHLDREVSIFLDKATPTTRAPLVWAKNNNLGKNVTIAIIDTGIAPHPDIKSRIIGFHDLIGKKTYPYDDNGHGTHCAGCAAGDGSASNGLYKGTAPKAFLVGVKVLNRKGSGSLSKVIAGIQWCIQNKKKYNIRVISLSMGTRAELSYKEDPICQMVELAWKNGITVVTAAGNNGPMSQSITSPGIHPMVITVGATDDKNTVNRSDDTIASFSSRGPTIDGYSKPDLVAPGTDIISLRSKSSYLDSIHQDSKINKNYISMSGTSMATPIVAGIAALMISQNPSVTPDQVKTQLIKNTNPLHSPLPAQGAGQVDAKKAIP